MLPADESQERAGEHQEQSSAEQSRTEQSSAEQSRTEQSRAEQSPEVTSSLPRIAVYGSATNLTPITDDATLPLFEDILPSHESPDEHVLYDIQTPNQSNALLACDVHAADFYRY